MQNKKPKNTSNKTYKLLDFRIKIHYVDKDTLDGRWIYGHCEYDANNVDIYISLMSEKGVKFTESELNSTLRHELFHVILRALYIDNLAENETIVEWLAQSTKILNKQGLNI